MAEDREPAPVPRQVTQRIEGSPNGLGISAGVPFWSAGISIFRRRP